MWCLHLFKQNLKFSSAHFLIFDHQRAERLHGHNYQVQLLIYTQQGQSESTPGYLVDFSVLKQQIKSLVDQWDEQVLLPKAHPEVYTQLTSDQKTLEVRFRERFYAFPANEVILLPIVNTSVELLSYHLAQLMAPFLQKYPIESFEVKVEETAGQAASYRYLIK